MIVIQNIQNNRIFIDMVIYLYIISLKVKVMGLYFVNINLYNMIGRRGIMNLDQLKIFVEVIDVGSINKAAERLYLSQPSLSRSIHALEDEMGKPLIIRNSRGVVPTPSGETFYYYAKSILLQYTMLLRIRDLGDDVLYSKLMVSVDSIFLKDNLIMEFYSHVNSQDTEIHIMETTAEEVLNNVAEGKSEIGITVLNNIQLPFFQRMCEWKNLDVEIVDTSPVYVHSKNIPHAEEISVNDVGVNIYLHLPMDFFSNINQSIRIDGYSSLDNLRSITMSNYHAIINMLNHTNSYIMGHKWQIDELSYSGIRSALLKHCDIEKYFIIIKRKRECFSDAGNEFYKIIKKTYSPT